MSNLGYSTITPREGSDPRVLRIAFVKPFAASSGVVFGVLATSRDGAGVRLAHTIRESLERWANRRAPDPALLETNFEHVVQSLNEACRNGIESETTPVDLTAFDFAIGAVSGRTLVMTGVGTLRATFLREEKPNTFHVYDLLRGLRDEALGADKLFGALVSGELAPGDTVAIALPEVIEGVTEGAWKQTIATMAPAEAHTRILVLLAEKVIAPLALILHAEHPGRAKENTLPSAASIEALRRTEQKTDALLHGAPRGLPSSVSRVGQQIAHGFFAAIRWTAARTRNISFASMVRAPGRALADIPHLLRSPRNLFALGKRESHRKLIDGFREGYRNITDYLVNRFNALPRVSKTLFIGALVLVVLSLQSIMYLHYRRDALARATVYNAAIAEVKQLQDDADASIIYHDEEKARTLLFSAREKINALPQDSRSHRATRDALGKTIAAALVTLRHEISVQPTAVSHLDPRAFDAWLLIYATPTSNNPIRAITTSKRNAAIVLADGSLALHREDGSITPLATHVPGAITDAKFFNERLYALVPRASQIYKLNHAGADVFGNANPWLKDANADLASARAIAMDGALYLLQPTGVVKFFTGKHEDWTTHIDPPLTDATRIWTADSAKDIYILEPKIHRVIALDKTGATVAQYRFPDTSDLKDFAVDEASKTLSVLDGTTVKRAALVHLK